MTTDDQRSIDFEWARTHIPNFAKFEKAAQETKKSTEKYKKKLPPELKLVQ